MNVSLDDGPVSVTLSRRNLLELLAELDAVRSGEDFVPVLTRRCENGVYLVVEAQEDDVHYGWDAETGGPVATGGREPGTLGMIN